MAYNQVNISSGHSINCQGMSDVINEVNEAIRVVNRVYDIVKANGKACYKYHDTASSSSQNLANIVNFHNQYKDGIDVSIHFNANVHTYNPMGVEVCYYSDSTLASQMSKAIADAGGFKDRGAKQRTGLYFLKHTNKTSILIEVCFGDSTKDCELYKANFEAICQAIAKTLIGAISVSTTTTNQSITKNNEFNEEDYYMYLFSENWYLYRYNDIKQAVEKGTFKSGYEHYIKYGKNEKRQPVPPIPSDFNEADYLELNQDIKKAVAKGNYISGVHHFMLYGFKESHRKINKGETDEEAKKRIAELEAKLSEIKKIAE